MRAPAFAMQGVCERCSCMAWLGLQQCSMTPAYGGSSINVALLACRAHCQLAVKRGHGWDPSREGRMPDASNSSTNSGPQGALIKCARRAQCLQRPAVLCESCALPHDGLSTYQVLLRGLHLRIACCQTPTQ